MNSETIPRVSTAEELLKLSNDGWRYELIRGGLRKMSPAGGEHGVVAMRIGSRLDQAVSVNRLGLVLAAETGFLLERDPDTVRAPDVAFVSRNRIPSDGLPKGYWPGAPDLAVEVVSPNDAPQEVEEKVAAWLRGGASEVWVIDPVSRSVAIHGRSDRHEILSEGDVLAGGELLPGFRCPIQTLFEGV